MLMAIIGLEEDLKKAVEEDITSCGLCKKCLFICPLPESKDLDVFILNEEASKKKPSKEIIDFAFLCFSCGACNYSCPYYQRMDKRLIYIRSKGTIPSAIKPLLHWRGKDPGFIGKTLYGIKKTIAKPHERIAPHLDKKSYAQKDLVFYFSCYAYSPTEVPWKTLALADHLGLDYEVIAGYNSCCGWPHYLAGDFKRADKLFVDLFALLSRIGAKEVVTGCAECYQGLEFIKERYAGEFEVLTTPEWILRHKKSLKLKQTGEKVTFHDACQLSRIDNKAETPRKLITELYDLVEMEKSRKDSVCCGAMRVGHEKEGLIKLRKERLDMAKKTGAGTMVTECLSCYEVYKDLTEDIEIKDLSEAVYDNLFKDES